MADETQQNDGLSKEIISKLIIGLAPALIGGVLGGAEGGAGGAKAGLAGLSVLDTEQEKAKKEKKEVATTASELRKEQAKAKGEADKFAFEKQKHADEMAIKKVELAQKNATGGEKLTASQTEQLANHLSSIQSLDDLATSIQNNKDIVGPVMGRVGSMNPYDTKAQALQSMIGKTLQSVGKSLEGGKMTKEDEAKYRSILPTMTDTPDVALQKIDIVKRMVAQKQQADIDTMGKAGYGVAKLAAQQAPEVGPMQQKQGAQIGLAKSAMAAPAVPDFGKMSDEDLNKYLQGK